MFPIGLKIIVNDYLPRTKEVQAKTHKRKRINKKWLKKYGHKTVKSLDAVRIGDTIYCLPEVAEKLKLVAVKDCR